KFNLSLDRSGFDLADITAAVDAAKESIQNLDERPPFTDYTPGEFNTSFRYELTDETGCNVARAGLSDLNACLPYTLAFVREIDGVTTPSKEYYLATTDLEWDDEVQILSVVVKDSSQTAQPDIRKIAVVSRGLTTIAIPVVQIGGKIQILAPGRNVPRLF